MSVKKNVFLMSGLGSVLFVSLLMLLLNNYCWSFGDFCRNVYGFLVYFIFPLPVVLVFSLITYKMKDEVFQAWFRFARWFVPIIMFFQFVFMNSSGGGSIGNNDFAIFFTSLFYIAFVLISLIKIVRAYKRTR